MLTWYRRATEAGNKFWVLTKSPPPAVHSPLPFSYKKSAPTDQGTKGFNKSFKEVSLKNKQTSKQNPQKKKKKNLQATYTILHVHLSLAICIILEEGCD